MKRIQTLIAGLLFLTAAGAEPAAADKCIALVLPVQCDVGCTAGGPVSGTWGDARQFEESVCTAQFLVWQQYFANAGGSAPAQFSCDHSASVITLTWLLDSDSYRSDVGYVCGGLVSGGAGGAASSVMMTFEPVTSENYADLASYFGVGIGILAIIAVVRASLGFLLKDQ